MIQPSSGQITGMSVVDNSVHITFKLYRHVGLLALGEHLMNDVFAYMRRNPYTEYQLFIDFSVSHVIGEPYLAKIKVIENGICFNGENFLFVNGIPTGDHYDFRKAFVLDMMHYILDEQKREVLYATSA